MISWVGECQTSGPTQLGYPETRYDLRSDERIRVKFSFFKKKESLKGTEGGEVMRSVRSETVGSRSRLVPGFRICSTR